MKKPLIHLATSFAILCTASGSGFAQSVELSAKDGSTTVTGELISTQGGKYTLRTSIGVVSFEANLFDCSGIACPVGNRSDVDLAVAGPSELVDVILPLLADGFAEEQEMEALAVDANGLPLGDRRAFEKSDRSADKYGRFDILLTNIEDDSEADINVQEASGQRMFDMLLSQKVDIIFSETAASDENIQTARQNGLGDLSDFDHERILAVDGFTGVVNQNNNVGILTVDQISAIASGEIRNWQDVGGSNHKINLYSLSKSSEAFKVIGELILDPFGKELRPDAKIVTSNRELSKAIESDEFGFGIVSFSSIRNAKPVAIENECGMVIQPNRFSMKSEEYLLQKRVAAYSTGSLGDLGQSFISYLDHPSVDDLIAKAGLISLSVEQEEETRKLLRLRRALQTNDPSVSVSTLTQLMTDILDTDRLSTTFRFSPQSSIPDNKARRDIYRVMRFIEDQKPDRVILAGFADADGSYERNRELSLARAETIRREMQKLGDFGKTVVEVRGYGELAPVSCNTTLKGRATNRRVEVWSE